MLAYLSCIISTKKRVQGFVRKTDQVVIFSCWSRLLCVNARIYIAWIIITILKDDIPIHWSLLNEIKEWKRHWTLQQPQEDPTTLFECYLAADEDRFPNIKALLRIGCTLPVGSADAERSFSCLRRLKTYLKNRMGEDRLSSLALMNIHHEFEVNTNKVIEEFKKKSNRQLFSISLLLD